MSRLWAIRYIPAKLINTITFKRKKVAVGKETRIYGKVTIKGKGKIEIGENCLLNSSIHADPIGGDGHIILRADDHAELSIGNQCGLSNCAIVAQKSIRIEDKVYIGGSVKIYDTDFHALNMDARVAENTEGIGIKPVVIHRGAFIGAHAIILKGVEIGENSVVGAGSVVTKSIPANEIWAGNPARKIRNLE